MEMRFAFSLLCFIKWEIVILRAIKSSTKEKKFSRKRNPKLSRQWVARKWWIVAFFKLNIFFNFILSFSLVRLWWISVRNAWNMIPDNSSHPQHKRNERINGMVEFRNDRMWFTSGCHLTQSFLPHKSNAMTFDIVCLSVVWHASVCQCVCVSEHGKSQTLPFHIILQCVRHPSFLSFTVFGG